SRRADGRGREARSRVLTASWPSFLVYDACVLYAAPLRDVLVRLVNKGVCAGALVGEDPRRMLREHRGAAVRPETGGPCQKARVHDPGGARLHRHPWRSTAHRRSVTAACRANGSRNAFLSSHTPLTYSHTPLT